MQARNGHTGPGLWYTISEKILTSAHQLISDDAPKATKVKPKAKPVKVPLKCQPKQEKKIMPKPVYGCSNDQPENE